LPKLYYYHIGSVRKTWLKKPSKKNQPRKPNQNGWVQNDLSKMAFWSSWTWGQKNYMRFFLMKFPMKKGRDFLQCQVSIFKKIIESSSYGTQFLFLRKLGSQFSI
jgi:hypothetical protein